MSLDADIATLRGDANDHEYDLSIMRVSRDEYVPESTAHRATCRCCARRAAVDRVETEIARLTEELAIVTESRDVWSNTYAKRHRDADALESELARLREGLRDIELHVNAGSALGHIGYVARALLAEDTPGKEALCQCGHSERNHYMESATPSCHATVYTDAPLGGGSAYPCPCRRFEPHDTPGKDGAA